MHTFEPSLPAITFKKLTTKTLLVLLKTALFSSGVFIVTFEHISYLVLVFLLLLLSR